MTLERAGIPSGVVTPIEVLARGRSAVSGLAAVPGVYTVSAPAGGEWHRAGTALAVVLPRAETSTQAGQQVIDRVRQELGRRDPGAGASGEGAQTLDFIRVRRRDPS